jgi:helix-turn-helix protein
VVLARNATGDGTVYLGVPAKVYGRIMAQHRWEGRSVLLVRSQAVVVVVVGAKH